MQKVLSLKRLPEMSSYMDSKVFHYIHEGSVESFESFKNFSLLAFDWYNIQSKRTSVSKILIYLDAEDLFFICKDDESEHYFNNFVYELIDEFHPSNEQLLYRFFNKLLRADMDYLDCLETEMNNKEAELLSGRLRNTLEEIINWQRELLRLKHYYEQLDTVFDEMSGNDNDLLSPAALKHILILGARTDRYLNKVDNMRELASQMHATYQAQLSIQQNDFMKVFTVVTAVFLPLTLLVGWYGMNFTYMPELHWQYSYPVVIASSAGIVIFLIWFFKHKKWL